jgi:2-polyprenyl-6-methoxyphenol hydroxylase-like FAD-dependent oxidoreductase
MTTKTQIPLSRTGYPCIFIDRQFLLQVLYDNLKQKDKVLTEKKVTSVEMTKDRVQVATKDGSVYDGSFLVGADGVHSAVRKEMWRIANHESPGLFSPEEGSSTFEIPETLVRQRCDSDMG